MASSEDIIERVRAQTFELLAQTFSKSNDESRITNDPGQGQTSLNSESFSLIKKHLVSAYTNLEDADGSLGSPKNALTLDLDTGCEWINVSSTPEFNLESQRGLIIVEFFTHCCINCIHSIEELRQVHERLTAERSTEDNQSKKCAFKIISIHSPKFAREKEVDSIQDFGKQMSLNSHSLVVNDPECLNWKALGIYCWPTILIFGPTISKKNDVEQELKSSSVLNLLFTFMGEGNGQEIEFLLRASLRYFDEVIDFSEVSSVKCIRPLPDQLELSSKLNLDSSASILKYPGKVAAHGPFLGISDSGNNRIVLCSADGQIQDIIGAFERGYIDGDFQNARFNNPQGLVFRTESVLFICDTGNHAIRKIDLSTKEVSTLISPKAKTMAIGSDPDPNSMAGLKSPWDLAFYGPEVLLIAGAGNHQIFGYVFEDIQLFGNSLMANTFNHLAGTGKEENRNNTYIKKASFSQPSGLAVSQVLNDNDKVIYVADAESSSIRQINSGGRVSSLVGGSKDPMDLFAYGDKDGCYIDVRLQHPLGVCGGVGASKIFIADSYNHKVKMIDLETKHCTTLIGTGVQGNRIGCFSGLVTPKKRQGTQSPHPKRNLSGEHPLAMLNEPGGLAIDDKYGLLYIADTNNHKIKIGNLRTQFVFELELKFDTPDSRRTSVVSGTSTDPNSPSKHGKNRSLAHQTFSLVLPKTLDNVHISLQVHGLPSTFEGGKWKVLFPPGPGAPSHQTGDFRRETPESEYGTIAIPNVPVTVIPEFKVELDVFFCTSTSCFKKLLRFEFSLSSTSDPEKISIGEDEHVLLTYHPDVGTFTE